MKFFIAVAAEQDSKTAVEAKGWFITLLVSSGQLKLGCVDAKCYVKLSWKAYNLNKMD